MVNAILIHRFSDNSLRKVKTDKADAMKIANYALAYWSDLRDYSETDETRQLLKVQCRLYERTIKTAKSLRNSLISILDQTFPGANNFFPTSYRNAKGHYKWVDFVRRFWHKDNVAAVSIQSFSESFRKWYKRTGYHYSQADAERIHRHARESVATFKKNDSTKLLICYLQAQSPAKRVCA